MHQTWLTALPMRNSFDEAATGLGGDCLKGWGNRSLRKCRRCDFVTHQSGYLLACLEVPLGHSGHTPVSSHQDAMAHDAAQGGSNRLEQKRLEPKWLREGSDDTQFVSSIGCE